jgi:hypothetical protein
MTINLDTEIVSSSYDIDARMNTYTIRRDGRRWTVQIPDSAFAVHATNRQARAAHLGNLLTAAMRGKADGET